jgi:hypothetical protein
MNETPTLGGRFRSREGMHPPLSALALGSVSIERPVVTGRLSLGGCMSGGVGRDPVLYRALFDEAPRDRL